MREHTLFGVASRQHGLIERSQIELSNGDLARWVDAKRLIRVFHAVYRVAGAPITREQLLLAPCLAAGPGCAVSHRAAVHEWELAEFPDVIEIVTPRAQWPRMRGVFVHRSTDLDARHITVRHGIPITKPLRSLVDLGQVARGAVADAFELGLAARLFSLKTADAALDEFSRKGRTGVGVFRRVVDERAPGGKSSSSPISWRKPFSSRWRPTVGRQRDEKQQGGTSIEVFSHTVQAEDGRWRAGGARSARPRTREGDDMTVLHSVIGTIQPGRYQDFLSQGLEVTKLVERFGAKNVRLLTAGVAGEQQGRWVFNTEHDDLEQYGAYVDHLLVDAEMMSLMLRLQSPDNPTTMESQTVSVEVPLGRDTKPAQRGRVIETHITHVNPGGLERSIADAKRACDLVERNGGRNARLFQLLYAGSFSGNYMITWEFENVQALGRAANAWTTDPEGQKLAEGLTAKDAATTILFSGLYTEVQV